MRQGIRVIDSDTHVNPSMDVLLRYADSPLRECMDDLAPYLRKVKVSPGRGDAEDQGQATILSIKQLRYSRVAGAKSSAPTGAEGDRGFLSARTHMVTRRPITARVADDNAGGRLADMDTEGRDIDFIIPGPWAYGADLPIMYHGFTIETPYFPGYRDVWENPAMSRCAGQTWGGQRFLSFMLMGGMLDRHPRLRVATLECGHGWLPHWLVRLTRQIDYVRGSLSPTLQHTPVEYAQMGPVFCGIDFSEGIELTRAVIDILGDHILMFESDYPHPETIYPDHAETVIAWRRSLGEQATQKLMWENAARFFRLTSTPW